MFESDKLHVVEVLEQFMFSKEISIEFKHFELYSQSPPYENKWILNKRFLDMKDLASESRIIIGTKDLVSWMFELK